MAKDYTSTLNLPATDFPMRANLPQREPDMLKYWDSIDDYVDLPIGSIEKLIGRKLTWDDDPVKI